MKKNTNHQEINDMNSSFELLLVKDQGNFWEVIGITYSNAMLVEPNCATLRATLFAIEDCKKALSEGKKITVSKKTEFSEVQPKDLVIETLDELSRYKQMAINEVAARMHQALFAVNVIDLMDYLNNYIALLNAGYYITDANREDKYFEVIEASQECEEPEALKDDATFEQEQEYIEKKQKYDNAQFNLNTLEKYLNSYDKLANIKHISDFLTETRKKIEDANSIEEINDIVQIYKSNLVNYKMLK